MANNLPTMTGAELKAWREQNNLTQAQLAWVLQVHIMTVSRWERAGSGAIPRRAINLLMAANWARLKL